MAEAIADLQGFKKSKHEFVLKEFAITSLTPDENGEVMQQCLIFDEPCEASELPYSIREANSFLTKKYHGIPWDAHGDYKYDDIALALGIALAGVERVYVKGLEKQKWLKQLVDKENLIIENLEDLGCPKLKNLKGECCSKHRRFPEKNSSKGYVCALRNVVNLKTWYVKYLSGCMEKSLKIFCELRDLTVMDTEDIQFLPKYFLVEFAGGQIEEAWDLLPRKLQRDPEILGYRGCSEHVAERGGDQFDGPQPLVKDCALCQLLYQ